MSETQKSMDRAPVILAGVVVSALGALVYNVLPLFLGAAQDFRQLSDTSTGLLGSIFYVGFTLTTMTAFFWIRRWSWRRVTLTAVPLAAASLMVAGLFEAYPFMLAGVFLAGCAFSALYGIGTTVLGDTSQPARWYGLKIASEAGLGAVLLLILPGAVITRWGFEGMMVFLALTLLLLSPLLFGMPRGDGEDHHGTGGAAKAALPVRLRTGLWLSLAAVMVFLFSTTMIWAFVERMASDAGFDPVATGNVLSLTLVFAVAGSLLAMGLGDRLGVGKPFGAACLLLLTSIAMLAGVDTLSEYATGACVFTFAFGLGIPYVVTIVAELDLDGRYVVLSVPAIGLGVMAAPAVGGYLTEALGYGAILWTGAGAVVAALLASALALSFGLPAVRAARRESEGAPAEQII